MTVEVLRGMTVPEMAERIIATFVPVVAAFKVWKFAVQFPDCCWPTIGENTKRIRLCIAKMVR